MNWIAISAVSDLLATVAVIVSLVYLGIQVKQSNKFAHGQTRRDYLDVDDATYAAHKQIVPIILGTQRTRAWWQVRGKQAFNPDFVGFVDAMLQQTPQTDYWHIGDNW